MLMKNVVLIDDYPIILESFSNVINDSDDFIVAGTFTSCENALKEIVSLQPDFVLIDISLPGMSGIEGIKEIKLLLPKVPILVISVHENSKFVFEALCAGAIGYLTKTGGEDKILDSLRLVENGGSPMSVRIARMVVESFQETKFDELTEKENEVLMLLTDGNSYGNIANAMFISLNTVKYHVRNIYEKLHISCKQEAIKLMKERRKTNG
jgi:DNA-binding NarL/FixJ family response regulator